MACRRKVQWHLVNKFRTLEEAEDYYKIDYFEGQQDVTSIETQGKNKDNSVLFGQEQTSDNKVLW